MKEISELYEKMLAVFQEKTGFRMEDTADLAVRLYAAAAEIQSLYAYSDWALNQSFPQTATGQYLDCHAQLRSMARKSGTAASGMLRFAIDTALAEDLTIPAGTVCCTTGLVRFVTTVDTVIPAGQLYADAAASAEQPGAAGNAAAGTVTQMTKAPEGVRRVTNPAAFSGGADEEDDESLRTRILDSFIRLPNGANAMFYEQRALHHAGADAVTVLPRYRGIGTVGVVVATASGEPDERLLQEIQADLDSVREIAVDVTVMAPQAETVNPVIKIWPADGVGFEAAKIAAEQALEKFFTGQLLGKPVYRAALGSAVYATGKVKNYEILRPAEDLAAQTMVLPRLGSLTVTEGGV